jgi:hypothetical protein
VRLGREPQQLVVLNRGGERTAAAKGRVGRYLPFTRSSGCHQGRAIRRVLKRVR